MRGELAAILHAPGVMFNNMGDPLGIPMGPKWIGADMRNSNGIKLAYGDREVRVESTDQRKPKSSAVRLATIRSSPTTDQNTFGLRLLPVPCRDLGSVERSAPPAEF
jgi:hypothetical protein